MGSRQLSDLAPRMAEIAEAIGEAVEQTHRDVTVDLAANLAAETPVDTGTARSNWVVRSGSPSRVRRRAYSPIPSRWRPPYGAGGSKGETANIQGVIAQAKAAVGRHRPGADLYVANSLPYIAALDAGRSPQSSAGFVHRAVLETKANIGETFARNLRKAFKGG